MKEPRPLPKHYLWYAEESNRAAGMLLRPKGDSLSSTSAAISIGLSLHAIELCGKSMLRSLGHTKDKIRKAHSGHDPLAILNDVQDQIQSSDDESTLTFRDFLLHAPVIDGQEFSDTIASYLEKHFDHGKTAYSRSYLYPDNPTFTGPNPISAIKHMADHLIESAKRFTEARGYESS